MSSIFDSDVFQRARVGAEERAAFAALVTEQPAMRHGWLRTLVTELRLGA